MRGEWDSTATSWQSSTRCMHIISCGGACTSVLTHLARSASSSVEGISERDSNKISCRPTASGRTQLRLHDDCELRRPDNQRLMYVYFTVQALVSPWGRINLRPKLASRSIRLKIESLLWMNFHRCALWIFHDCRRQNAYWINLSFFQPALRKIVHGCFILCVGLFCLCLILILLKIAQ